MYQHYKSKMLKVVVIFSESQSAIGILSLGWEKGI